MKTSAKIIALVGITQSGAYSKSGLLSVFSNQQLLEDIMVQEEAADQELFED
jgi:hypothetical protein